MNPNDNQKEHHSRESYAEECETFLKFYQQTLKKEENEVMRLIVAIIHCY